MKNLLYGTVSLVALASAIAVPASAPKADLVTSPVEERGVFQLFVIPPPNIPLTPLYPLSPPFN